jgi:hypothetical protein
MRGISKRSKTSTIDGIDKRHNTRDAPLADAARCAASRCDEVNKGNEGRRIEQEETELTERKRGNGSGNQGRIVFLVQMCGRMVGVRMRRILKRRERKRKN